MKKQTKKLICDANEAVARVAHKTNEVCAIYPITPASPMGEHVDVFSSKEEKNIILFGFMGTGKSAIARRLGDRPACRR